MREIYKLAIVAVSIIIASALIFYKDMASAARTAATFVWIALLPGYAIMLLWKEKLDFVERIIIGSIASLALLGIASYYIGLLGLHIKYHGVLLPIVVIAGFFVLKNRLR